MDPNLEFFMRTLTEKFDTLTKQLGQVNKELGQVNNQIGNIEKDRLTRTNPKSPPIDPRVHCHDLTPEYKLRYPCQGFVDQDERVFRSNRPYAPTFDGKWISTLSLMKCWKKGSVNLTN